MPTFSRPQSLSATRRTLEAHTPVLLSNVPRPALSHAAYSSSRSFYAQPSPGAILANGASAVLQKKIVELMRRQSDTIKWELKNNRGSEHRAGLNT